ncbi:magnesium transporter NIPA domain-containing protein [Sarocladium implicatum]|nr:magnesium transporter NIPA domain-containing protein [Sarocladium implicatum]
MVVLTSVLASSLQASRTTLASTVIASASATATGTPPDDGDKLQNWSSLIGIVTAIVGNILIALALNVQRYAHTRLQKKRAYVRQRARAALKRAQSGQSNGSTSHAGPYGGLGSGEYVGSTATTARDDDGTNVGELDPLVDSYHSSGSTAAGDGEPDHDKDGDDDVSASYLKSPYWWLGQVLITLGEMGNFLAYGFAPASIVSPLGVVALISNCIIAPAMFHERFRHRDFWGVVIAVGGVVTVVLSAKQEETKLDPHAVWDAITELAFEIYLAVTITLIIVLMWASPRYGKKTILIDLGLVGLFGGYTALATKGVSSMLSSTLWRAFTTPVTYVLIFILLGTAIMQIRYVNKALQRFDSTQVIPIQFVMFTLCVILGSAILYRDFERTTAEQAGKFVGGCLLTFFGVFLITSGREAKDDDDDDIMSETDGIEETIGLARQESGAEITGTQSRSRRSSRLSRVSFASTVKPGPPQQGTDIPSLRYPITDSPLTSPERETEPLLSQVWSLPQNQPAPPRGLRTLSADSVMLLSSAASPSIGGSQPVTPLRDGQVAPLFPPDGTGASRPGALASKSWHAKRSGTFISPSPFSSTVTAVVKDAFLRPHHGRLSRKSSMRRLRSSIRASLFFNNDDEDGDDTQDHSPTRRASEQPATVPASEANYGGEDDHEYNPEDQDTVRRRTRSVSDTIGSFFRPNRKRRGEGEPSSDAEYQPGERD